MTSIVANRSYTRIAYIGLGVAYVVCLLTQFLFAGMSVFDNPSYWVTHKTFVHLFGYVVPALMLLCAMLGKFTRLVYKELVTMFLLIFVMYFTGNIGWHVGWLGALHPVIGVLLTATAVAAIMKVLGKNDKIIILNTNNKVEKRKSS